jgi:predicted ATPase/DNA-binding CsgD family transcriptional regulator
MTQGTPVLPPAISPFVGRQTELRTLLETASETNHSRNGSVVIIGGEAGVGKTRLLREFVRHAPPSLAIASGACREYGRSALFPILQVFDALRAREPEALARFPRLRTMVERLRSAQISEVDVSAHARLVLFQAIDDALAIYATKPLAIVIEDLQWADDSTLALLQHLSGSLASKTITLLLTHRVERSQSIDPTAEFLRRVRRFPNVHALLLPALTESAIGEIVLHLMGAEVDRHTRIEIAARAEGNALFAEELAKHVLAARDSGTRPDTLPQTIADTVRSRLDWVPVPDRPILLAAAVIGRTFDANLLAAITGEDQDAILKALRHARVIDLIVEDDPPEFSFKHALVQEAVYGELLSMERHLLHERILEELRQAESPDTSALAYHAWAARRLDLSVLYNERAGDDAWQAGAWIEASDYYDRAVESTTDIALLPALYEKLARALARGGFPDRALRVLFRALSMHESRAHMREVASTALAIFEILTSLGDDETGMLYLQRARDALIADPTNVSYLQAVLYTAHLEIWSGSVAQAVERLEEIAHEVQVAPVDVRARYHATRADAHLVQRQYTLAIEAQSAAIAVTPETDARYVDHLARLGELLQICARLPQAAAVFADAAVRALQMRDHVAAALYRICHLEMLVMQGLADLQMVRREVENGLEIAMRSDAPALTLMVARQAILYSLRNGDRTFSEFVDRLVFLLEIDSRFRFSTDQAFFPLTGAYASWLLNKNREQEAMKAFDRSVARLGRKFVRSTDWSLCTLVMTAAHGDITHNETLRTFLAGSHSAFAGGFEPLIAAIGAARRGNRDEARNYALIARERLAEIGMVAEVAASWELAGDPERAIEAYEIAGAPRDAERVRRSLVPVNRRGRSADSLTEREREIAELLCAGRSNRAIADALNITEKTVETHVTSIFNRLGVRSRRDVASAYKRANENRDDFTV